MVPTRIRFLKTPLLSAWYCGPNIGFGSRGVEWGVCVGGGGRGAGGGGGCECVCVGGGGMHPIGSL